MTLNCFPNEARNRKSGLVRQAGMFPEYNQSRELDGLLRSESSTRRAGSSAAEIAGAGARTSTQSSSSIQVGKSSIIKTTIFGSQILKLMFFLTKFGSFAALLDF